MRAFSARLLFWRQTGLDGPRGRRRRRGNIVKIKATHVQYTAMGQNLQLLTMVGPTVERVRLKEGGISRMAALVESRKMSMTTRSAGDATS